ncbi:MAG: YaaA family protein, partial [Granulosicoccaceae bacterium]
MLVLLSPAKTLDFETPPSVEAHSKPAFLKDSKELIEQLKELSAKDVGKLMSVSDKISELNVERFNSWKTPFTTKNAKPAAMAFRGDVYLGLDADTLDAEDFDFAQGRVRILSGLYGVLRPLDLIQPYRLEMGTRFANQR